MVVVAGPGVVCGGGGKLGGGRSSGVHGVAATVQGRPNGRVIRAPGDSLSALTCSEASLRGHSRGGGMASGEELSALVKLGLRGAKEAGKRGVRSGSTQRCRRGGQRARGGPGGAESTGGELGCPRLKTRQKRRCGAPAVERTGVDDEGDDAGPSGCFGKATGGRWPRWFSSAAAGAFGEENRGGGECSGEREERGTGRVGEGRGGRVASPGRRGGAKQAGREEVAGARGRARRARARPPGREEDDTGRRRWWAGPGLSHSAGPVWLPGERQVGCG